MQFPWSRPGSSRDQHNSSYDSSEETYRRDFFENIEIHQQQILPRKNKRYRSAFSTEQINYLEMEFQKFPYIDATQRKEISNILNIPERAIKIWFQNRRMREKKETLGNTEFEGQSLYHILDLANNEVNRRTLSGSQIVRRESSLSLPTLTVHPSVSQITHIDLTDPEPDSGKAVDSPKPNYYNDLIAPFPEISLSKIPKSQPGKSPKKSTALQKYRASAEFSIDLCKKYKNFGVTETKTKVEDVTLEPVPSTSAGSSPRKNISSEKDDGTPEDLSCNLSSKDKVGTPSPPKAVDGVSPGIVPVYLNYPQPFLAAGNLMWKPMNVLPMMPPGVPVASSPGSSRPAKQSKGKKKCNCDCHSDIISADDLPNTIESSSPIPQQDATALSFQNYPKF